MSVPCPPSVPLPFAGVLRITDVTHSTMKLNWDAAPGAVLKYIITYKPEEGDLKEVKLECFVFQCYLQCSITGGFTLHGY